MKKYLNGIDLENDGKTLPIFHVLTDNCLKNWCQLQNIRNFSASNLQSTIEQLPRGSFLPLYFNAQNAAILIEIEANKINQPLISSWQVSLPTANITSSPIPHLSCFPVATYRLKNRIQLSSKVHCELLFDFMRNTIEYSKSSKASHQVDETRDIPESHYVWQWWIQHFQEIEINKSSNTPIKFKKKHRDHIRWNNANLPFRRSGLWLTIKVVLQTILTKRLGSVGTVIYKLLITRFLTYVIGKIHSKISIDLLIHCIRKIVRRLNKIEQLSLSTQLNDVNQWIQHTKEKIHEEINMLIPKSDWQERIRINEETKYNSFSNNFDLNNPHIYQHSCQELKKYISHQSLNKTFESSLNINTNNDFRYIDRDDYIPLIDELRQKFNYTIDRTLTCIELWIELHLNQWINRPKESQDESKRFEILFNFYEKYQSLAVDYYWSDRGHNDPIGYSRFILTLLTIVRSMHERLCNDSRFQRLKQHSINIPDLMHLFEYLVLPNQKDMIRARDLRNYFNEFSQKSYPDLLSKIDDIQAFGVNYAPQSQQMKERSNNCKIELLSSVKSATQSHYSYPPSIASSSVEDFLFENSLNIQISPTKPMEFNNECRILTPQLDHPDYKQLQCAINNTDFIQNNIIADLSNCAARLKPNQFIEFGSFRSGHRLQWWNLLVLFEMDSLPIAEESVVILITHAILQYGPQTIDQNLSSNSWCAEAHEQILDDHFIDELIIRLDHRLDDCKLNWQNELVLVIITIITMRMLTICNSTREDRIANLAIKCRKIGETWIDLISENIQILSSSASNEIEKLRLKLVIISISCLLTFSTDLNRINYLLLSNEDLLSLLKASTTIHDNIILNKNRSNMSTFMKNMMRFSIHKLVILQPKIAEFLQKTSYKSLNNFSTIYWAVIRNKGTMNGRWKKRTQDPYDGWYDCQYETRIISINCIQGTFLVDGMTVGFLPEEITTNELFIRIFGSYIFEVQLAESPKTYITKHTYHGNEKVQYEFCFNKEIKHLTITERHTKTNEIFQLISDKCFQTELPDRFVSKHSHWLNLKKQILQFRHINFKEPDFLNNIPYILSLETGYFTTTTENHKQILINQSSTFFMNLFNQYFNRLDDKPYVYMMCDGIIVHIHLSRLGIAFEYNVETNIIKSREYSDMCISKNQWLGTFTSLTSGLLLSPLPVNKNILGNYPYRKLIVPFGNVQSKPNPNINHQIVTIDRPSTMSFSYQYFVFVLNDRLKILQSTDSPTGWLYLALLHAMTSHPLPDEYTGMTGMERAFQLLNSAGCYSDQPFDEVSLNILSQIALISPKVNYYPKHLTCMEQIDWNANGLPYSMQHFGYYLIAKKLIETSQLFNFMYPSMSSNKTPELFGRGENNETLLKKLYFDYRDSYNPLARLSQEMERDTLKSIQVNLYSSPSEYCKHINNYNVVYLVNDLYSYGNVNLVDCSNRHWLPLSQWMTSENNLKDIWIGLLKMAHCIRIQATVNDTEDIQRFESLLDFLHYISSKRNVNPFYLQMLKTALKSSTILLAGITFPSFVVYTDINEISFREERIDISYRSNSSEKEKILGKAETCWRTNQQYPSDCSLATSYEVTEINRLLKLWRSNGELRSFLQVVQHLIQAVPTEHFHVQPPYHPQKFECELAENHYQIQIKPTKKSIDSILLQKAKEKFHNFNSGHFNQRMKSMKKSDRRNEFPEEIFSSTNEQNNGLSQISDYFRNQLVRSWEKFLADNQYEQEYPSIKEISQVLNSLREESIKFWNELFTSITSSNEQLVETGLILRMTPTTLIPLLQQETSSYSSLTEDQRTILGGIVVNWTLEQQIERILYFAIHKKLDDFKKEISHIPHSNWKPSEHISWLILELEMNITIREIQINVAKHMIQPNASSTQNIVMQLNMGEGKTSVILPMLAVNLSSSNSTLVRIIVLKSLFPTNYQSLRYKLGGLLNQRIFSFACRRDMNFNSQQINQIHKRFQQALCNCDILLTSPEDILSFDLLTIDKCRRQEFNVARSMLATQRQLKKYVRDILDESDEILHVKYQLIYTVGNQQEVDEGSERWKTIQKILELAKKHAADISKQFHDNVCYKAPDRKSTFPQFRLQTSEPFLLLCQKIAKDWIDSRNYRYEDKQVISIFILETNSSVEHLVDKFPHLDIQLFLIIRGLLSSEVLLVTLKKRYRVNYGVNPSPIFNRLMAVPFRAKDVVADRTEFGHPDVALVLTHLSYYYSGLNDSQLSQCFKRLSENETDPTSIYDQWILYDDEKDIPKNIRQWNGVNLKDYQQQINYLFPTFRYNVLVINYFLNYFVFPREAKQFPSKLVASAWDLSSSQRTKIVTGFSGTNDTQLLLPIHIRQYDLPELQKTDAIVVNNLLKNENENYQYLPINVTSENILKRIVDQKEIINVILDVGALFIDGTNRDIAIKWLKLSDKNKIDYVVYFDSDSIVVCDRHLNNYPFVTSPASERLDRCIFYLDEIHTRGTDFKFPIGFKAAVTLGNGLTKDRFVQACMRMRKLGHGHSLIFSSSYEVHQQIKKLKIKSIRKRKRDNIDDLIKLIDILRWVYENTQQSTWDGLHHWASQSLSHQRKASAFRHINWNDDQQEFTEVLMKNLANECSEPEIIELRSMYGASKTMQTLVEIHRNRYEQTSHHMCTEMKNTVLKRLEDYAGTKQRLAQLLDEEQQRELEQELEEERQVERPPSVQPCQPILHDAIKQLCDMGSIIMNLTRYPNVFRHLPYAFTDTTFVNDCQANNWQENFWISTEFQRVIETKGELLNPFLRPPRWIIIYRNQHLIFLSALEANWLMGRLNSLYHKGNVKTPSNTTLRLLLPRIKRVQSIFVNTQKLTVPPLIAHSKETVPFFISPEWLAQLFIFNGTLYFENVDEQTAYCQCLSLCPKPQTKEEEEAFKNGWITVDGFVSNKKHRRALKLYQVRFHNNLLEFARKMIENRNDLRAPITSHVVEYSDGYEEPVDFDLLIGPDECRKYIYNCIEEYERELPRNKIFELSFTKFLYRRFRFFTGFYYRYNATIQCLGSITIKQMIYESKHLTQIDFSSNNYPRIYLVYDPAFLLHLLHNDWNIVRKTYSVLIRFVFVRIYPLINMFDKKNCQISVH
ncbi:unnamed protein product [Rotaria sordida]|uniref:ubiquitinyl hydrolase 1 n=1 Tax=Rotaria sordida TaxID=392033 RepID=A0A814VGQ8_9BILA|nr:unnamed protein product [Rotaria sordida]